MAPAKMLSHAGDVVAHMYTSCPCGNCDYRVHIFRVLLSCNVGVFKVLCLAEFARRGECYWSL